MILSTVSLALFSKFGHNLRNQLLHPPTMAYSLKTVRSFPICFLILPFSFTILLETVAPLFENGACTISRVIRGKNLQ